MNTTGADFVFEPSYRLMPLAAVNAFIKQNRHLPNIAPAAEMQRDGIEVGQQQAKLLQKVEELTLYLIEMKRDNDRQQKEIEGMTRRLSKQTRK